jgi:hypothetical protein
VSRHSSAVLLRRNRIACAGELQGALRFVEAVRELLVGEPQDRAILPAVIADFVTAGSNGIQKFRRTRSALADQEEGGAGVMLFEYLQDLRSELRVGTIVKGKAHEWFTSFDAEKYTRCELLEHGKKPQRSDEKDVQGPEQKSREKDEDGGQRGPRFAGREGLATPGALPS